MKKPSGLAQDNQFLDSPKKKQKLKVKEQLSIDLKAKYINDLQERNRKLKFQIMKINQMIEEQNDKPIQKKERKLLVQQSSQSALRKQLQIVYKNIKACERQIKIIQQRQSGGLVEKMIKLQSILKEKTDYLQKIKSQSISITKNSMANVRKLKNNSGKQQLQNSIIKSSQQIKRLRERIKDLQVKSKKKKENAKKQYNYVKKLQSELIDQGVLIQEIQQIKQRKKQYLDAMLSKQKKQQNKDQQNRVKEFNDMKNEIKLLKKLHSEYEKKLQDLEQVKKQQQQEVITLSQKIQQKNEQLQQVQDQIQQYRVKINKVNIKPTYSYSKPQKKQKKEKPQMLPSIIKQKQTQKSVQQILPIKYDQKGIGTEQGKRFTDRNLFGKSTNVKIVGVKVWTQKRTFAINGIQCIYKFGDQKKIGQQHINKDGKKFCSENTIDIDQGDYIRLVSGHISEKNVVQYLIFITKKKVVARFGMAKAKEQKQFNFNIQQDQIPICMYGSILKTKDPKTRREGSVLENIGFEICKDKSYKKEDKLKI